MKKTQLSDMDNEVGLQQKRNQINNRSRELDGDLESLKGGMKTMNAKELEMIQDEEDIQNKNALQIPGCGLKRDLITSSAGSLTHNDEEFSKLIKDMRSTAPRGKFLISKEYLKTLVEQSQRRNFCEQVDDMQQLALKYIQNGGKQDYNNWIYKMLFTNPETGINSDKTSLNERETAFDSNRKEKIELSSFFEIWCGALEDFTLKLLLGCSLISIVIGVAAAEDEEHREIGWIEGFAIFVTVFICSLVAAGNDYSQQMQFDKLNKKSLESKLVFVFRNGSDKQIQIHRDDIMVGDVIQLDTGMEVPADGYLISGFDVRADESALTGESEHLNQCPLSECIEKREELKTILKKASVLDGQRQDIPSPILLSGTSIVSGEGKFIAISVGKNSTLGEIEQILKTEEIDSTPLQKKLEELAEDISQFGLYSAILIIIILLLRFAIERGQADSWDHSQHWKEMLDFIIIAITILVVAIPEGLPLSVTISLSYSGSRMLKDKNLVQQMVSCETMGGADCICSDQTGTLTKNEMTLVNIWNVNSAKVNTVALKLDIQDYVPSELNELFIQSTCINSGAELDQKDATKHSGSATEIGILKFIRKCGIDYRAERQKFQIFNKIPFSSKRKLQSVIINLKGDEKRMFITGASEIVLQSCKKIHDFQDNTLQDLNGDLRRKAEAGINQMAQNALRTIAIAYKKYQNNQDLIEKDERDVRKVEQSNFILIALLGIADVPRDGVPEAVLQCQKAGITVRMVTGDNQITAKAIAKQVNIISQADTSELSVMLGQSFMNQIGGVICSLCRNSKCDCPTDRKKAEKLFNEKKIDQVEWRQDIIKNDEAFNQIYPHLRVLARSRPEDKYALVVGLRKRDHVVAVTGDGTNDAPALKKADVGFAMGIAGTEVSKNAADIIIIDDNFTSIVKSVMWGRNVYDAIKKFVQFQLTVNVVAVMCTLVSAAVIKQEILKPIQMLWINLCMDTFAALALATEPPTEELLNRKPQSRKEHIITVKMAKTILLASVYQAFVMFLIAFHGENFLPEYKDEWDTQPDFKPEFQYNMEYYPDKLLMHSGRLRSFDGSSQDYISTLTTPSRHFTFLFNVFVCMTQLNFMNARKINDEKNVFSNITSNSFFFAIVVLIVGLQIIFVTFGFRVFNCYQWNGLTVEQWLICYGFAIGGLFWSFLIKFIPENKFFKNKEEAYQD